MENEQNFTPQETAEELENARIRQEQQQRKMEQLLLEQNLPFGIIAGLVTTIVMALLWAFITVVTKYQIGYMAVAVGFVVGYAVRFAGKGIDNVFGIVGAALAFLGCLLGNFFGQIAFGGNELGVSYFDLLSVCLSSPSLITEIMKESFSPMDLVFYGIAVYEGYRFSFRNVE